MLLNATLLWKRFLKASYAALLKNSQPPDPPCLPRELVPTMGPQAVACIIPKEGKRLFHSRASDELPVFVTLSVFVNVQNNRNVSLVGRHGSCWKVHTESSKAVKE